MGKPVAGSMAPQTKIQTTDKESPVFETGTKTVVSETEAVMFVPSEEKELYDRKDREQADKLKEEELQKYHRIRGWVEHYFARDDITKVQNTAKAPGSDNVNTVEPVQDVAAETDKKTERERKANLKKGKKLTEAATEYTVSIKEGLEGHNRWLEQNRTPPKDYDPKETDEEQIYSLITTKINGMVTQIETNSLVPPTLNEVQKKPDRVRYCMEQFRLISRMLEINPKYMEGLSEYMRAQVIQLLAVKEEYESSAKLAFAMHGLTEMGEPITDPNLLAYVREHASEVMNEDQWNEKRLSFVNFETEAGSVLEELYDDEIYKAGQANFEEYLAGVSKEEDRWHRLVMEGELHETVKDIEDLKVMYPEKYEANKEVVDSLIEKLYTACMVRTRMDLQFKGKNVWLSNKFREGNYAFGTRTGSLWAHGLLAKQIEQEMKPMAHLVLFYTESLHHILGLPTEGNKDIVAGLKQFLKEEEGYEADEQALNADMIRFTMKRLNAIAEKENGFMYADAYRNKQKEENDALVYREKENIDDLDDFIHSNYYSGLSTLLKPGDTLHNKKMLEHALNGFRLSKYKMEDTIPANTQEALRRNAMIKAAEETAENYQAYITEILSFDLSQFSFLEEDISMESLNEEQESALIHALPKMMEMTSPDIQMSDVAKVIHPAFGVSIKEYLYSAEKRNEISVKCQKLRCLTDIADCVAIRKGLKDGRQVSFKDVSEMKLSQIKTSEDEMESVVPPERLWNYINSKYSAAVTVFRSNINPDNGE